MGSRFSLSLSMNRPTPALLSGGERAFTRVFRFPSWEGLGVGSWSQCTAQKSWAFHEPQSAAGILRQTNLRKLGGAVLPIGDSWPNTCGKAKGALQEPVDRR